MGVSAFSDEEATDSLCLRARVLGVDDGEGRLEDVDVLLSCSAAVVAARRAFLAAIADIDGGVVEQWLQEESKLPK